MKTSDFYFELPPHLIAQYPTGKRGESRLLVYNRSTGKINHSMVTSIPEFLEPGSVLVFNNTRVRKARLFGYSETGGKTEFLLLSRINGNQWSVICSKSWKQKQGKTYIFPGDIKAVIKESSCGTKTIEFETEITDEYLEKHGHIPLPPYIRREDEIKDSERYQTVFSEVTGSAAAPTAGLHFTENILQNIRERGVEICFVTLHVGLGTFQPVRSVNIKDHKMHEEWFEISSSTAETVNRAKARGSKIIAAGTTSLRALESSAVDGKIVPGNGSTALFIYPGYEFKITDHLFTNFHTPDSSLIILVSAFAGTKEIKTVYSSAINENYRFYSYGDAMLIL